MGRRQAVRHGVLISAYLGSNPSDPATISAWAKKDLGELG